MKNAINTDQAPAAVGPYSQAISTGDFIFTAGQIPIVPATKNLIAGGIREQAAQVIENIQAILKAAGSDLSRVIKTNVYLVDPGDFAALNEVYGRYFPAPAPARTTVFVSALPKGAAVEIDAIAAG